MHTMYNAIKKKWNNDQSHASHDPSVYKDRLGKLYKGSPKNKSTFFS